MRIRTFTSRADASSRQSSVRPALSHSWRRLASAVAAASETSTGSVATLSSRGCAATSGHSVTKASNTAPGVAASAANSQSPVPQSRSGTVSQAAAAAGERVEGGAMAPARRWARRNAAIAWTLQATMKAIPTRNGTRYQVVSDSRMELATIRARPISSATEQRDAAGAAAHGQVAEAPGHQGQAQDAAGSRVAHSPIRRVRSLPHARRRSRPAACRR